MSALKVGQLVKFEYFDHDKMKEVHGTGRIAEIDENNGVIYVQTTRTFHWMEYDPEMKNIQIISQQIKNEQTKNN